MAARILVTDRAETAVTKMQQILSGSLLTDAQSLNKEGQELSDANVWDGPLAVKFRGTWTETYNQVNNMIKALEELRAEVQTIHQNIFAAGGR